MDAKAMNFHEGEFDTILDKATLDAVLVIFFLWIVWLKLDSERKQTCFWSVQSSVKDRSVYLCIIRSTRVQTQLLGKTRVWVDCEGSASRKTHDSIFSLYCFRRKRVTQRSLHLHLQKRWKGLIHDKLKPYSSVLNFWK